MDIILKVYIIGHNFSPFIWLWIASGYLKNEEATEFTIKQGWLHTGDLGYFDEGG